MAYTHPGKEAERRVKALVESVNSALTTYYETNKTSAEKRISISLSLGAGGKSRTPAEQAAYLLKGTSWTANSAHMAEGAKHILLRQGGIVNWHLHSVEVKDKAAFAVMVNAWNKAMKKESLHNFKGGATFDHKGSDPLHMELPQSKLSDSDPHVIETLEIYAKATRLEKRPKNIHYENEKASAFQKSWLKNYDLNLAKQKK